MIKVYYIPDQYYELGKTAADFDGITLSIYDRERTIVIVLNIELSWIMNYLLRPSMHM